MKDETAKFQEVYEKFCKEKTAHLQALKGSFDEFYENIKYCNAFIFSFDPIPYLRQTFDLF